VVRIVVSAVLGVSSADVALLVFPRVLPRIDGAADSAKPVLPFSVGMRDVRPFQKWEKTSQWNLYRFAKAVHPLNGAAVW